MTVSTYPEMEAPASVPTSTEPEASRPTSRAPAPEPGPMIGFRTHERWPAGELVQLIQAVETIYGVFLALTLLGEDESHHYVPPDRPLPAYPVGGGPRSQLDELRKTIRVKFSEGWFAADEAAWAEYRWYFDFVTEQREFLAFLRWQLYARDEASRLDVSAVATGSAGRISFTGLDEPIRRMSDLLKDLWFGARQHEPGSDLMIIREHLALDRVHCDMPGSGQLNRPVLLVASAAAFLAALDREGKLVTSADLLGGGRG